MSSRFNYSLSFPNHVAKTRMKPNTIGMFGKKHSFLVQKMETLLEWEDVVLNPVTEKKIYELKLWLKHKNTLSNEWGMHKKLKPGFRALFHGSPGTGKKLTATLLGKDCVPQKQVYRIDLSLTESKYIGETEKNLSNLFNRAENSDWILFFDEADALFGKRTEIKDAHDRYANLEIAYFLQRVEEYRGLAVLATNNINNIDKAFLRRFEAIIYFPLPTTKERLKIFNQILPKDITLPNEDELYNLFGNYKISGSDIVNAARYSLLKCIEKDTRNITIKDLDEGFQKNISLTGINWEHM